MRAQDDIEGAALFYEEVEIQTAVPGQLCALCGRPVVEGDRVRIRAEASDGPRIVTHVRCAAT
jgi:RNase P subunit RPR2